MNITFDNPVSGEVSGSWRKQPRAFDANLQVSPEHKIRKIVENVIAPNALPLTGSFQVYYIRAIGDGVDKNNNPVEGVVFPPTFMYVLEVGLPAIVGVGIPFRTVGLGDPNFPDFETFGLYSIDSLDAHNILWPSIAGEIFVGVRSGTSEADATNGLQSYMTGIKKVSQNSYFGKVTPFFEEIVGNDIKAKLPFVDYVQKNSVMRLIDTPWFISRVI